MPRGRELGKMSPLSQRAMEPTKAAFGKAFWDQEAESAAALDGHVRVHQSHAPPFSLAMPSGLARSQQLYMMQRFLNIPATPSYVKAEDGMVLDRVIANVGGRTWWHTLTLRLRRSAPRTRSPSTRADPTASSATLPLYALGGRFRAGFSRHTVLKAFGELGSLKGLLGRFGGLRRADPNASNPNVTNAPQGVASAATIDPDEIPRGRVTLRPPPSRTTSSPPTGRAGSASKPWIDASRASPHVTLSLASRGPPARQLQGRREAVARRDRAAVRAGAGRGQEGAAEARVCRGRLGGEAAHAVAGRG